MTLDKRQKPIVLTPFLQAGEALSNQFGADFDCSDCACSMNDMASIAEEKGSDMNLKKSISSYTYNIDKTYTLYYGPYHQPSVLNQSAVELLEQFNQPQSLQSVLQTDDQQIGMSEALLQLSQARLLCASESKPVLEQTLQHLDAWIHVTDRCNLRCEYCYLPHKRHDMDMKTGKSIIDKVFCSAAIQGIKKVKLKYSGGEALLRFSFINELHQYAQKVAKEKHIELRGVVLSNGTLMTEPIAKSISALGLNLMVSLDGLGRSHDAHRSYADGRGSFEDVRSGIKIAQNTGIPISISITVSDKNSESLAELVRWILAQDMRFSINFFRDNKFSNDELSLKDESIIQGILAAYKEIERNLPDYSLMDAIVDRANLSTPHLRTCGVGQNYMVFDHSGKLSKCHMQLYDGLPNKQSDQPLKWVQTSSDGVQNPSVEDKDECNTCKWKYWCAGGCPLVTYRATGTFNTKSPNCRIYKAIFPEAMRLEGLRILQIHHSKFNTPSTNNSPEEKRNCTERFA